MYTSYTVATKGSGSACLQRRYDMHSAIILRHVWWHMINCTILHHIAPLMSCLLWPACLPATANLLTFSQLCSDSSSLRMIPPSVDWTVCVRRPAKHCFIACYQHVCALIFRRSSKQHCFRHGRWSINSSHLVQKCCFWSFTFKKRHICLWRLASLL